MKLSTLIHSINTLAPRGDSFLEPDDPHIYSVHYDSRTVKPHGVFVAVKGFKTDGHSYLDDAVKQGASAIVVEDDVKDPRVPCIRVNDSRKALALLADTFYGHPSKQLHITGVTGTNGKTSTTYLLEAMFKNAGLFVGVIGTINYRYGDQKFPNPMTTPESLDLQRILFDMHKAGVTHVIMEVSSHALDLDRVYAIDFNTGVFTNLSQDHLDYHETMDRYFDCKKRFFTDILATHGGSHGVRAVINQRDDYGQKLMDTLTLPVYSTCTDASDIRLSDATLDITGISGTLICPQGRMTITSDAIGDHNQENILNASGAALCAGISLDSISEGVRSFCVPGRLERITTDKNFYMFVDYAHTPDGLYNVLKTLKPLTPGRVITVFGCGGDRDKTKRPLMGQIAEDFSDMCFVTSDNPRSENPDQIIDDIQAGMSGDTYCVEPDRQLAIRLAVSKAIQGDSILIAGKGHETYQILNTGTIDFDDRVEARKALELCES